MIVQYLLHRDARTAEDGDSNSLWMAACLLEKALAHSPYNPHLKLVSLYIYSRLGAASKSLELYKELGVKQIQLDSCPFVILNINIVIIQLAYIFLRYPDKKSTKPS